MKDGKIFTICDIDPARILSCVEFKRVIRAQLNEEITPVNYDVGLEPVPPCSTYRMPTIQNRC